MLGDLRKHLKSVKKNIRKLIPDPDFDGVAVIDMEEWRPLWRRNWSWKKIYRTKSIELVEKANPEMISDKEWLEEEATRQLEKSARNFMKRSLRLARKLRPKAQWGYYHYPYSYNNNPPIMHCRAVVTEGNDEMRWLWRSSSAIFPSTYIFREDWTDNDSARYIFGNIEEGLRVAEQGGGIPVYAYTKMKYNSTLPVIFYSEMDMLMSLRIPADFGIDGVIIWGSKGDYKTAEGCKRQKDFLKDFISPYSKNVLQFTRRCAEKKCSGRGRCVHKGVVDDAYADQVLRDTMDKLYDFSTENYVCRCEDGKINPTC